ncbi:MAG: hypothetical protein V3T58_03380 [Candidatus Hydrothermarchaeales archaeon]
MRYALKVFYDGRNFYGSQRQRFKRTVEGARRYRLKQNFRGISVLF